MIRQLTDASGLVGWSRALRVVLVVALLTPLIAIAPRQESTARAQPALLEVAAERPEDTVPVIVQKRVRSGSVEQLVAELGGVVTKDLWIINALAAELPAASAPVLARAADVHWVSLDAPVIGSTATCGGLVQDLPLRAGP